MNLDRMTRALERLACAVALDRAYATADSACRRCGLPATRFFVSPEEDRVLAACDLHVPKDALQHGDLPNAEATRRLVSFARGDDANMWAPAPTARVE